MGQLKKGKLSGTDEAFWKLLTWAPWFAFALLSLPLPIIFLLLFITAAATDTAAWYLLLSFVSLGVGTVVGLIAIVLLLLYRRNWLHNLRNRLAADGITANEVTWFTPELTSAERRALNEIQGQNALLGDAYLETLATRLMATRIRSRARRELIRVERRINRARLLRGVDATQLVQDLQSDRDRYAKLQSEADQRLVEAQHRLQSIEAAASRDLNEGETELMLQRLATAQETLPLVLEMAKLEENAARNNRLTIQGDITAES